MSSVRPRPLGKPVDGAPLSAEEGFVLSRVDGNLSIDDLGILTGIGTAGVEQIVTRLASRGAIALEAVESKEDDTASLADFASALGMDPSAYGGAVERPVVAVRVASSPDIPPPSSSGAPPTSSQRAVLEAAEEAPPPPDSDESADKAQADADETAEAKTAREQDYRKIYEERFRTLTVDVRAGLAKTAHGGDLLALCLDADPRVISGILENPSMGLAHVRLIAFHHRTATGLEMVSRRAEILRDLLVERRLLRNPMSGDIVLGRVLAPKRVFQTYKIAIDRDVPELTRTRARGHLRQKWGKAPPEDRSDLILRTEGRCFILMTGCTFDAKTTGILCGRQYNSILFIQNFAKFPATPPAILAHLVKQAFVRKIPPLKKLLLQHPNMPGDVKRNL